MRARAPSALMERQCRLMLETEPIEDPQTPGLMTKPSEHPLQHSWCVPVRGRRGELYIPTSHFPVVVGEELDEGDEICGVAVSLRSKVDRIQVWVRSKEGVEKINGIGRKLVKLLDVSEADEIEPEFQVNVANISLGSPLFFVVFFPSKICPSSLLV